MARSASADASLKVALAEILLRRQATLPPDRRSWREFENAFEIAAKADPGGPATVALLRGELFEGLGKVDEAAAEYRLAWQQGMDSALPRLVTLLANHGKVDALAALRRRPTRRSYPRRHR